jgi:hypothetical protein
MILYAYANGYYYELHLNLSTQTLNVILRYRDGHEKRPTRMSWDDLDSFEQDLLLPKIRKAVSRNEENRS